MLRRRALLSGAGGGGKLTDGQGSQVLLFVDKKKQKNFIQTWPLAYTTPRPPLRHCERSAV